MSQQNEKIYSIGEFARMTNVTERTLRYYDRQGLLKPSVRNEHGRRFYKDEDIFELQKILTLKYLDFSLDEIAGYLQKSDYNLQSTLDAQYDLLRKKQEQLNQVIKTLDRMRLITEGAGTIDSNMMLVFIHSLLHEQTQKEFLAGQLPKSFVQAIYMDDRSSEDRLDIERRMTAKLMELRTLYKQGKDAADLEVQQVGLDMMVLMQEIIGPAMLEMSEEELAYLEQLDGSELPLYLFPTGMTKEEEAFIMEVFERLQVDSEKEDESDDVSG